jgi:hypothetical protein
MGDSVCLDGMYPFCATVVKVFGKHTLGNQMLETQLVSWLLDLKEASLRCLDASIISCIINVLLERPMSYMKLYHHIISGFESLSLTWRDPTMTSTCCKKCSLLFARFGEANTLDCNFEISVHQYNNGYDLP